MSLFNSRTDTEKEIEEIRKRNKKHVNNESQNRNFGFGTQNANRYGRAITTYKSTNKDKVDNLPLSIDTNKKSNAQNNKVSTDNKKDTLNPPFLDIKTIIWIIISVALSVVFYEQNNNLALLFFGQLLFGLGFVLYSNRTTKPAVIKLLLAVLKLIGASMLFSATVFLMNGRSSSILKEAPLMSLFFGVFWAVALWGLVVNLTKVIISIVRCTEKVTAKVISYKVHRNTEQGDVYSEIYKYSFNDKIYTVTSVEKKYYNGLRQIGSQCELKINPHKPNEFFENFGILYSSIAFALFCIPFLVMPLIMVVCFEPGSGV